MGCQSTKPSAPWEIRNLGPEGDCAALEQQLIWRAAAGQEKIVIASLQSALLNAQNWTAPAPPKLDQVFSIIEQSPPEVKLTSIRCGIGFEENVGAQALAPLLNHWTVTLENPRLRFYLPELE